MGIAILGIFIIYIVITLAVLVIAVKFSTEKKRKWVVASLVILTSILIPTWDIPIGRINFNHLCKTQAGQFIYKQVPLSDEYFLSAGERDLRYQRDTHPFAFAKGGELNLEMVKQDYVIKRNYVQGLSRWGYINKRETSITTLQDKDTLSYAISFQYGGGWLSDTLAGGRAIIKTCPGDGNPGGDRYIHVTIIDNTFQPIITGQ